MHYPEAFLQLLECFKHLPGIGSKSAERLVYHVLNMKEEYVEEFADALVNLKANIHKDDMQVIQKNKDLLLTVKLVTKDDVQKIRENPEVKLTVSLQAVSVLTVHIRVSS